MASVLLIKKMVYKILIVQTIEIDELFWVVNTRQAVQEARQTISRAAGNNDEGVTGHGMRPAESTRIVIGFNYWQCHKECSHWMIHTTFYRRTLCIFEISFVEE